MPIIAIHLKEVQISSGLAGCAALHRSGCDSQITSSNRRGCSVWADNGKIMGEKQKTTNFKNGNREIVVQVRSSL